MMSIWEGDGQCGFNFAVLFGFNTKSFYGNHTVLSRSCRIYLVVGRVGLH